MRAEVQNPDEPRPPLRWWWLAIIITVGFVVRVVGLSEPSLSHPEAFIPGIDLPEDISWPEPRLGFFRTIHWHFFQEPHPVAYYASMWVWTAIFGTSTFALRLPSVLFGTASIALIFLVADRVYGRRAAWIASAMLALHGFHVFWSGQGRMYVSAVFFALLATLALVEITRRDRAPTWLAVGYVAALTTALHSTELSWVVWGLHFGWVALAGSSAPLRAKEIFSGGWKTWRVPQLAGLQTIAFVFGLPELGHSLYQSRHVKGLEPNFLFFRQYFTFGFLLEGDGFSVPMRIVPTPIEASIFVFSAAILVFGLRLRAQAATRPPRIVGFPATLLLASVAASTLVMLAMVALVTERRAMMLVLATFPAFGLTLPIVAAGFRPTLARVSPAVDRVLERGRDQLGPVVLLGVLAPILLFGLSTVVTILASRAFSVFVPFLLILSAASLASIRRRPIAVGLGVVVSALFIWMCDHGMRRPNSPRDYRTLAERIQAESRPGDVLFVRYRNWADTPLLYYIDALPIVGKDYQDALAPGARVWVPHWPRINDPSPEIDAALEGMVQVDEVTARHGRAVLFAAEE